MGYVVSHHGSDLLVAAQAVDERAITHALERLKTGLFLDVDHNEEHGCLEYKVRLRYSRSEPPVYVCVWRDEYDRPLPLSSALIEHVKKLIETDTSAQVDAHNRAHRAQVAKATGDEAEEIAREMLPIIQGKKGAVLPRSQSLRMARDKRRGRGGEGVSLRDELDRLKARIEEIDAQLADVTKKDARLKEERLRLVTERQEIKDFLDTKGGRP